MKITKLKPNKANPRLIKDDKFRKLVNSIKEFPAMMELRPIVVDTDFTILGGNMRFKALSELGYKDIPDTWVKQASELTDAEKRRFIISDNSGFGEWDTEALAEQWDLEELEAWGVDVADDWGGDIEELPSFNTTYNINIYCETPEQVEEAKHTLGITSSRISFENLKSLING